MKYSGLITVFVSLVLCVSVGVGVFAAFKKKSAKVQTKNEVASSADNSVLSENEAIQAVTPESADDALDGNTDSDISDGELSNNSVSQSAATNNSVSHGNNASKAENAPPSEQLKTEENPTKPSVSDYSEIRAVWISFIEYQKFLKGKSKASFKASICEYFNKCAEYGLNTVIVHTRSHGDAYYKSAYFPSSVNFTGSRTNSFPFDPLEIMVEEAHKRGLRIEAWVNPYRGNSTSDEFAPNDPIQKWLGTDNVFIWKNSDNQSEYYHLNPGEPEARELIIKGIIELVDNYDIDGIHFDDYFYPTAEYSIDSATYQKYGGGRTLKEFRTDCVNELVSSVYREIKARKNITFGISPAGNIDNCLNKSFADVVLWGSTEGYADYIMPQLYWDYGEGVLPFETALSNWRKIVTNPNIKLAVGLAAYKVTDTVAEHWASGDILKRQVEDSRKAANYGGFALYRYEYFFSNKLKTERENLKQILG